MQTPEESDKEKKVYLKPEISEVHLIPEQTILNVPYVSYLSCEVIDPACLLNK